MTSFRVIMVSSCAASSGLPTQCKYMSLCLDRTKPQRGVPKTTVGYELAFSSALEGSDLVPTCRCFIKLTPDLFFKFLCLIR